MRVRVLVRVRVRVRMCACACVRVRVLFCVVREQIKALREGIDRVFPWKMLCVFSPAELQQKLYALPHSRPSPSRHLPPPTHPHLNPAHLVPNAA